MLGLPSERMPDKAGVAYYIFLKITKITSKITEPPSLRKMVNKTAVYRLTQRKFRMY